MRRTARDPDIKRFEQWAVSLFAPHKVPLARGNVFDPRMSSTDREALLGVLYEHGGTQQLPESISLEAAVDVVLADRTAAMAGHTCFEIYQMSSRPDSYTYVLAQSCYSGLRVRITAERGALSTASALSKSSDLDPIKSPDCPDRPPFPQDPPVWRYAGLGIGSGLYLAAMAQVDSLTGGDCRCIDHASNELVAAARWKLHCGDPYKWKDDRCQVCTNHGIDWDRAHRTDFSDVYHDRLRDEPEYR